MKIINLLLCLMLFAQPVAAEDYFNYEKEFKTESMELCSTSSTKTYMDYRAITNKQSSQWKHIQDHMTVDQETGLLLDEDGFIGVALGYVFGDIGSRFYFELSNGQTLPVVKIDAKASVDAPNGCQHSEDSSVIEFVIDKDIAGQYFGTSGGYVSSGNFNNIDMFKGSIVSVEKVTDQKEEEKMTINYSDIQNIDSYINIDYQNVEQISNNN